MAKPYGSEHERARKIALKNFTEGSPCVLCKRPCYSWQRLQLHHIAQLANGGNPTGPRVLVHGSCNERDGQRISARNRRGKPRRVKAKKVASKRRSLPEW